MFDRILSFLKEDLAKYQRARSIGLFRDAFTQRGYPIDAFSDIDIERAIPTMYQAIGEKNMEHDAELRAVRDA